MTAQIKIKVQRKAIVKLKVLPKFPAGVFGSPGITITRVGINYTFSLDPSAIPNANLQALAGNAATGIWTVTNIGTGIARAITGTANEVTLTNGDGNAGNPTVSLPTALTFTGKTVTGGTYAGVTAIGVRSSGTGAFDLSVVNSENLTAGRSLTYVLNDANRTITLGGNFNIGGALQFSGAFGATLTVTGTTTVTLPTLGTLATLAGAEALTNKSINGLTITSSTGTLTIPAAIVLTGPAASGTVMTLGNAETVTGAKTFGSAGAVGKLKVAGTTSGSTILDATAVASGTLTLPAATDTLVGKATTDILTNKSISGATNTLSAVPLSALATQAAFTFVGNNTSGVAAPTAVDVATLTAKASPAATDLIILSDQAASGAWKKATVSSVASAGSVASIAGNTGAFTLSGGITNLTNDIRLDGAFGFRNRLINPTGQIFQQGFASTADAAFTGFDQWYALTQSNAITPSSLVNSENGTPYMMRFTQANAAAQRFGAIQHIEKENCIDLRGQSVVLSARVQMSASTTLRYAIIEWTGTADAPTKDVVFDWTSATFTAGNFFIATTTTITSTGSTALTANTLASISLTGTIGSSANNIALFFWTDSTQAQNVTLDIGKVQLEAGVSATPFTWRPRAAELVLCQRYLPYFDIDTNTLTILSTSGAAFSTTQSANYIKFPAPTRVRPTGITVSSATHFKIMDNTQSAIALTAMVFGSARVDIGEVYCTITSGLTLNQATALYTANAAGTLKFTGAQL